VAISPESTFTYTAIINAESLEPRDLALVGQREVILSARGGRGVDQPSLCGPSPRVVIVGDRLSLVATDRHNASVWKATCLSGDATLRHAEAGDVLHIARSIMAGVGISLLRDGELVLAMGAASVPLGGVSIGQEQDTAPVPFSFPFVPCEGMMFTADGESRNLKPRESAQLGPYHIYVERCGDGSPDDPGECIAISRAESSVLRNAAMRSAILMRESGLKITGWDFFS